MFPISAALLDAMVLSLVDREETYGYKITQDMQSAATVSESTLYPVLRRLQRTARLRPSTVPIWDGTGATTASQSSALPCSGSTGSTGKSTKHRWTAF